jgi:hypothetical protein
MKNICIKFYFTYFSIVALEVDGDHEPVFSNETSRLVDGWTCLQHLGEYQIIVKKAVASWN